MEVPISAKNLLEKELSSLKNKRLDGYWKGHFFVSSQYHVEKLAQ